MLNGSLNSSFVPDREIISTSFDEKKWTSKRSIEPSLVEFFKKKSFEWDKYTNNLVDSHCHFEMLFSK